jgi:methionyl-tRNA formyltransferase
MRVVFMGTPEFAVSALAAIVTAGHQVAAVYSQPPRPAGRGMAERTSAVHAFADGAGIPVLVPRSLKGEAEQRAFAAHGADVGVVVAYGLILPKPVLEAPRHGCLNLHASALPRWRGAAPIQRAIMAGDAATAAAVMRMDAGLDTGPVCLEEPIAIGPDTTAGELHDILAERGAALLVRALAALEQGRLHCRPQAAEGVTYAAKIGKDEGRIDFSRPAGEVHNLVRGLSPVPGAWFEVTTGGKPERIKVLRAMPADGTETPLGAPNTVPGTVLDDRLTVACGRGVIRVLEVQRAGRKPMAAGELLRGFPLPPGTRL